MPATAALRDVGAAPRAPTGVPQAPHLTPSSTPLTSGTPARPPRLKRAARTADNQGGKRPDPGRCDDLSRHGRARARARACPLRDVARFADRAPPVGPADRSHRRRARPRPAQRDHGRGVRRSTSPTSPTDRTTRRPSPGRCRNGSAPTTRWPASVTVGSPSCATTSAPTRTQRTSRVASCTPPASCADWASRSATTTTRPSSSSAARCSPRFRVSRILPPDAPGRAARTRVLAMARMDGHR